MIAEIAERQTYHSLLILEGQAFSVNETHIKGKYLPTQSTPNLEFFSLTCLLLISARVSMGANPEFSAKANGMASRAEAKALTAYCSIDAIY